MLPITTINEGKKADKKDAKGSGGTPPDKAAAAES